MNFREIGNDVNLINPIETERVKEIVESLLENGWIGAPMLLSEYGMFTGSHRLEALRALAAAETFSYMEEYGITEEIAEEYKSKIDEILETEVAVDVTEEVEEWMERTGETLEYIDYSELGKIFEGTWVEEYKDEIVEW